MKDIVLEQAALSVQTRRRIRDYVYETPSLPARADASLFFKAENFQHTGSFKFRGAVSKMTAIAKGQGLITASSGNHGIASAKAASLTGNKLTVVLPKNVTSAKLGRIQAYGVEVLLEGDESGAAEAHAQASRRLPRPRLCLTLQRSRHHRRARHDRARASRAARAYRHGLHRHGRRRADLRHRLGDEELQPRREDHRRRGGEFGGTRPRR
jgi:cysteine synthase